MHFSAPEKPGKYLKTPFRRRRSVYTHFCGAGEVLICTYLAPERPEKPEKPEKYLYTPVDTDDEYMIMIDCCLTISVSLALQCLWSVNLILHKQFIDLLLFNCKSIRPKPDICISQTLITC